MGNTVHSLASAHIVSIIGKGHVSYTTYFVHISLEIGYLLSAIHNSSAAGVVAYSLSIVGNESVAVGVLPF